MIRRSAAVVTVLALALLSGPVSLADIAAPRSTGVASGPSNQRWGLRTTWPGGSVDEQWHSRDELSLYVRFGGREVEFRYRGTGGVLDTWVIISDERSPIDLDNLHQALRDARGGTGMLDPERLRKSLSDGNRETLNWIAETTHDSTLFLTRVDERHMGRVIAMAEESGLEKNTCAGHVATGSASVGAWLLCISAIAGSGGASLAPCFIISGGVYFNGYQALEVCGGGGSGLLELCNCTGPAPDCMCCPGLNEGDDCRCYCGGPNPEECCDWPDAKALTATIR